MTTNTADAETKAGNWPFPTKPSLGNRATANTEKGWSISAGFSVFRGAEGSIHQGKPVAHGIKTKKLAAEKALQLLTKERSLLQKKLEKLAKQEEALFTIVQAEANREAAEKAAGRKAG